MSRATQLILVFCNTPYTLISNILFLAIPTGFALYYTKSNAIATFCVNFVSILPSSRILGYAIDDICLPGRATNSLGLVLNNTFSNAAQLISAVLLLRARFTNLVHFALMGSIFSNLLLMTGLAFLTGGLRPRRQQYFNAKLAHTIGMLLLLATLSLIIPTVAHNLTLISDHDLQLQSRGTAIVILLSYCLWLGFQLGPDREIFLEDSGKSAQVGTRAPSDESWDASKKEHRRYVSFKVMERHKNSAMGALMIRAFLIGKAVGGPGDLFLAKILNPEPVALSAFELGRPKSWEKSPSLFKRLKYYQYLSWERSVQQPPQPCLDISVAFILILVSTTLIGFNTEFATNSIQNLLEQAGLSQYFVGLIILPWLSCEPASIAFARGDRLDLSISVTLDRCMMTALMVVPLIVLLAWALGIEEMTLSFDAFTIVAVFVSIVIVTYVVHEGRSNWLMGALLIKVYVLIAIAAFFIQSPSV